jgi:hypothetical protein
MQQQMFHLKLQLRVARHQEEWAQKATDARELQSLT